MKQLSREARTFAGFLSVASVLVAFSRGCEMPVIPSIVTPPATTATAVTYVYEKDDTAVPSAVMAGIDRLNREKKLAASIFEEDTVDGSGEVPLQYKAPLSAAQAAGLPAIVATFGDKIVKVVKDPQTEEAVMGVVQ